MQKLFRVRLLLPLLGACALVVWLIASPVGAQVQQAGPASVSSVAASETWSLGITVEGAPTYNAVVGRLVSQVGAFRSARVAQAATIFPAPATARTVQAASFYLLSRTGAYAGTATLSLVIYDYAGTLQHTVSVAAVDLQTTPTGVWTALALSAAPDDLAISPGEFLAYRFLLSGAAGGDLDVRPLLEVVVQ